MSRHDDFQIMLAAARAGGEWAWRALYEELAPAVLRYVRARGAPDPEDITGDVFVQVVRKISDFEGGPEQFRAWTFTIVHHRLIDGARSRARRPVHLAGDEVIDLHGSVGDVEQEALRILAQERVDAALEQLSPDQRNVLMLRIVADLPIEDVAVVLGKTPGAVKSLQSRAIATLKRNNFHEAVSSPAAVAFQEPR